MLNYQPCCTDFSINGAVAQLGEHKAGSLGVRGSSPLSSTIAPTMLGGRPAVGQRPLEPSTGVRILPSQPDFVSHGRIPRTLGISARHAAWCGSASRRAGSFCRWRYRLTVRTGGSQPPDRGSIPRSATIPSPVCVDPRFSLVHSRAWAPPLALWHHEVDRWRTGRGRAAPIYNADTLPPRGTIAGSWRMFFPRDRRGRCRPRRIVPACLVGTVIREAHTSWRNIC